MKNRKTINQHLTFTLIIYSLVITLITAISLNLFIDYHFNLYSENSQKEKVEILVQHIINNMDYEYILNEAKKNDIQLTKGQNPGKKKNKEITTVKLSNGEILNLEYSKIHLKEKEIDLKNSINKGLIIIEIFVFILSLLIGKQISKKFSTPLKKLTKITNEIKKGKFKFPIEKTNIIEIDILAKTLNEMAVQIEKNIEYDKRVNQDIQHELRTPLTNIQAQIESMIDGIWEINTSNLQLCLKELERMGNILNQLQQLDRIENGIEKITQSKFDLNLLVKNLFTEFQIIANKHNQKLENKIKKNSEIKADYEKIKSALSNLIINSIKYSGLNTKIEISLQETKDNFKIFVKDNGKGLNKDDLIHIKQRFYRAEKSRSRELGGSGLGLSIVEAIAIAHNGSLEIKSIENQNTIFTLILKK